MAQLILVRHGQIAANLTQHWHGSTDSPLTAQGQQEVVLLAQHLRSQHLQSQHLQSQHLQSSSRTITAVYASPLQRTRDTGQGVADALGLPLQLDAELREYGIGELEGQHYQALQKMSFFARVADDHEYAPPGGESIGAVARRVCGALQRIATRHHAEQVVVVSHGAALGIALGHLLHDDPLQWTQFGIKNCSITELTLLPVPSLLRLNDVEHLHS